MMIVRSTLVFVATLSLMSCKGALTPFVDVSGRWEGSGTFTLNCPNPAWKWVGAEDPPSVVMNIQETDGSVVGTITFNIPESDTELLVNTFLVGLQTTIGVAGAVSSSDLTLTDGNGGTWKFGVITGSLQGNLTSAQTDDCTTLKSVDRAIRLDR